MNEQVRNKDPRPRSHSRYHIAVCRSSKYLSIAFSSSPAPYALFGALKSWKSVAKVFLPERDYEASLRRYARGPGIIPGTHSTDLAQSSAV